MSIGQKLEQVVDLVYEKGYTKGGLDASPQETVSGEIVAITDISPIEHNVAAKAASKNLLDINAFTMSGATATVNGDSITFKRKDYNLYGAECYPKLVVGETYTFSIESISAYDNAGWGWVIHYEDDTRDESTGYKKLSFTKIINKPVKRIIFRVGYGTNTESTLVKPQIEEGTTATPYTPFVPDVSAATLKVCGKNLLNEKAVSPIAITAEGVTRYGWNLGALPQGKYTLTVYGNYNISKAISYKTITNGVYSSFVSLTDVTKSITIALNGSQELIVYLFQGVTELYDNVTLQLEKGVATEYEPYIEPTSYPIAADGTVEDVTSIYPNMTITTDTDGVIIEANYYQDGKKVKENLIDMILSLGGVINE